jgi:hypothetical protein
MKREITTLTGFSGADMRVHTDKSNKADWETGEGVAFLVQAITWEHPRPGTGGVAGSLVLCWAPNPTPGPHNIIITLNREEHLGEHITQVIYEVELLDNETGEEVPWEEAELAKVYVFVAKGFTGWISNE